MTAIPIDVVERVARALHAQEWNNVAYVPEYGSASDDEQYWRNSATTAIAAYRQALEDEGMVVVPREPTEAMKTAEGVHWNYDCHMCGGAKSHWEIMLAAAPPADAK